MLLDILKKSNEFNSNLHILGHVWSNRMEFNLNQKYLACCKPLCLALSHSGS